MACIQTQIEKSITDFNGSTTSCSPWLFLGATLKKKSKNGPKIQKIVAFGGGSLGFARNKEFGFANGSILAAQTQHAALNSIRQKLEIIYRDKNDHHYKIDVYLQDPSYTEEDKKAAKKFFNMTIVDGTVGFGEAWLELDESTLVFDLRCINSFPPLYQIIFEITRPFAIISVDRWEPDPARDEE